MNMLTQVRAHPRKKPFADRKARINASLAITAAENLAREEKRVDDAMRACMKTFAINVWRAEARGALGGGA